MSVPRTMDCTKWFVYFCVFLELCSRSVCQSKENYISEAGQVLGTIFHKYNAGVLPWANYPKPLNLLAHVKPVHVAEVDPVTQTMTSTLDLEVTWSDKALAWFTIVVKELTISKDDVWHPHIYITNAVGKVNEIENPDLILKKEGVVTMKKRLLATTLCKTANNAVEYECSIRLGTILYDSDMVIFADKSTFDTSSTVVANTLELTGSSVGFQNVTKTEKNMNDTIYPELIGTLKLSKTDCCQVGNGVSSLSGMVVLTAFALVIAMFAQHK